MGVSSATLAPFWANDFSTANWADETWFWPARNKDHSIRPAVQRKGCRVGKETGPGELGMVFTGILCAQTLNTGMISRFPKVEHQLESTVGEFWVQPFFGRT